MYASTLAVAVTVSAFKLVSSCWAELLLGWGGGDSILVRCWGVGTKPRSAVGGWDSILVHWWAALLCALCCAAAAALARGPNTLNLNPG